MEKDTADEVKCFSETEIDQVQKLKQNFQDVCWKFRELNHAFRINIENQQQLEEEYDTLVHEYNRLIEEGRLKEEALEVERNRWKEAFMRQRDIVQSCFIEGDEKNSWRQCKGDIKSIQEKTDRQVQELLEKCEKSEKQVELLEVKLEASLRAQYETTTRILKIVNLLETRENFHNNESQRQYSRCLVQAMKAIAEGENSLFERTMISLNNLYDEGKINGKNESYLVSQNSVLCEIIRNLKKRLQSQAFDADVKDERNNNCSQGKFYEKKLQTQTSDVDVTDERNNNCSQGRMLNGPSKIFSAVNNLPCELNEESGHSKNINNMKQYELSSAGMKSNLSEKRIDKFFFKSIIVEVCGGSLDDGVEFEECIMKLRNGRELVKFKQLLGADLKTNLDVKFVGTEREYNESSLDETTIYPVPVRKTLDASTQTILSGEKPLRIKLLSSEKKAIEENLSHLEKTMNDLKSTAINQLDKTIRKGSKNSINQLHECLKLLEH